MSERTLRALTARDIRKAEHYILVRILDSAEVVVNRIEVVTEPQYDEGQGVKIFEARCSHVSGQPLSEEEGAQIELSLDDIGCPWNRSRAGMSCCTFPYGEIEYQALCADVLDRPGYWSDVLQNDTVTIKHTIHQTEPLFSLPKQIVRASTALSNLLRG